MSVRVSLVLTAVVGISTTNGPGFDDPSNGGAYGARATTGYADVGGGKLYYEVAGEGPTVVLIHDGLLHCKAWDEQFQPFAKTYRVIRYDRRGFGLSKTSAQAYSDVEDLRALLKHMAVSAAALVGSSSGGGLAIDFTLAYPDVVDGLVLVGAVVRGFGYSEHFIERNRANRGRDLETTIEHWASDPWTIAPGNSAVRQRVRELLLANPQNLSVDKHRYATPPHQPALGRLSEIRVPTLIVGAEADIPDVHAHAGAIQAGIAGAKRVVISRAGHLVYLEQPEEFNRVALDFLSSVYGRRDGKSQAKPVETTSNADPPIEDRDPAAKARQMEAAITGYVKVDGAQLYYEVLGEGPPLVLIHAGSLDLRMWDGQFETFAKHYKVIRYDVRRHGRTQSPGGKYSDSEDLYRLLKHLGIDKAYVVGLSLGGRIAIDFTLEHPDMVSALIPVAPGLSGYQFTWEGIRENLTEFVQALEQRDLERATEYLLRCWTDGPRRTPDQVDPAVRERVRGMLTENLTRLMNEEELSPQAPAAIARLKEIRAPTLVIVGDLDAPAIATIVDKLVSEIDEAKKVVIPGVGHMVNMERPDKFNRTLLDFLSRQ